MVKKYSNDDLDLAIEIFSEHTSTGLDFKNLNENNKSTMEKLGQDYLTEFPTAVFHEMVKSYIFHEFKERLNNNIKDSIISDVKLWIPHFKVINLKNFPNFFIFGENYINNFCAHSIDTYNTLYSPIVNDFINEFQTSLLESNPPENIKYILLYHLKQIIQEKFTVTLPLTDYVVDSPSSNILNLININDLTDIHVDQSTKSKGNVFNETVLIYLPQEYLSSDDDKGSKYLNFFDGLVNINELKNEDMFPFLTYITRIVSITTLLEKRINPDFNKSIKLLQKFNAFFNLNDYFSNLLDIETDSNETTVKISKIEAIRKQYLQRTGYFTVENPIKTYTPTFEVGISKINIDNYFNNYCSFLSQYLMVHDLNHEFIKSEDYYVFKLKDFKNITDQNLNNIKESFTDIIQKYSRDFYLLNISKNNNNLKNPQSSEILTNIQAEINSYFEESFIPTLLNLQFQEDIPKKSLLKRKISKF